MKHARKLASLLLALVMVFALATTAFAAGSGSITVDNPIAGQTYTAYKIFDVVYNDGKTAYSYTIDSGNEWFSTVQTFATEAHGLTLTQVNGSTTYNVTTTNAFSAPDFAAALKADVSGKTGTTLTAQGNTVTASSLPLGYYFVTSTNGALCNLTTTNPSVTIHDKNDVPFEKTDDNTTSVEVGQTVNYTITGKVPDTTGFTSYTYKITDTMSEGLTFQKNIVVTVGNTNVTNACTVTYTPNETDVTGFELSIPVKNYQTQVGAQIKVTYSAVVNEKAVAKIAKNKAVLKYSNDPTKDTTTDSQPQEETVYSSKIVIDKYETGKENTKLADAKFVLYKEVTAESATEATKMYYKWNDTDKKVEWVTDKAQATTKVTDNNGATSFDGLADGTYYLEETAAPAGYNLLTEPVEVTVNGSSATTENVTSLSVTAEVANDTGALLPSTGGMGTTIFYVLGSILVVGAVVLLVTKKRMSSAER